MRKLGLAVVVMALMGAMLAVSGGVAQAAPRAVTFAAVGALNSDSRSDLVVPFGLSHRVSVPLNTTAPPSVPDAPTVGMAAAANGQATVLWTAPAFDGGSPITGYVVTPYVGYWPGMSVPFNSTATTETMTGLANGTTYRFRVQAVNAIGTGAYSKVTNPVTPSPSPPGAPTIGTALAGNGAATVSWTAPASDGGSPVAGYVVTAYVGYSPVKARIFNSTSTTETISRLSNATQYRFRVRAYNAVGVGAFSKVTNPVTPAGPGATAVSAGVDQTCALVTGGTVECWGGNQFGELGNGTTTNSSTPVAVTGITDATAVSAGFIHTCAVVASGTVECWGDNFSGELGNGTTTNSSSPVAVTGITDATAISAGNHHTCALLAGGTVECWGDNAVGGLGNGTTSNSSTPVVVTGITDATAIGAGDGYSCALSAGGTVECWGSNHYGQLGTGTTTDSSTPVAVTGITGATAVSAGLTHACAVVSTGTVECWGFNGGGELGNGTFSLFVPTPVTVTGITDAMAVSAGGDHTCALLAGGTVDCWGNNLSGQLGVDTTTADFSSTRVTVNGLSDATAATAGDNHTCALVAGGAVKCWGGNPDGELGNGTTTDSSTPVTVLGI